MPWLYTRILLGYALQAAALIYWAWPRWGHAAAILLLSLGAGGLWLGWQNRQQWPPPGPYQEMAALGGAGMALGAAIDWHGGTPACLCCIYGAGVAPWKVWWSSLGSASVWLMLAPQLRLRQWRKFTAAALISPLSMLIGMHLAGWLMASVMPPSSSWKLELGHLTMLLGMCLGCQTAAYIRPETCAPTRPSAGGAPEAGSAAVPSAQALRTVTQELDASISSAAKTGCRAPAAATMRPTTL